MANEHRIKLVQDALVDLISPAQDTRIVDLSNRLRPPGFPGDTIAIPEISDLTVASGVDSSYDAQDVSVQSVTRAEKTLSAVLNPSMNVQLELFDKAQNLDGSWATQIARQAMVTINNKIDDNFCDYLGTTLCYDTTATLGAYTINSGGDTLAVADILNARSLLCANRGTRPQDLVLVVHPYAMGSLMSISGFLPNYTKAEQGIMGFNSIGSIFGIPVYESQSVSRRRTVACTAVSISSNVATVTVPSGHGIASGMKVSIAGITTPLSTASIVLTSASTSFTVALTASDGAMADGAGTVTIENCENLMYDRNFMYTAIQVMPQVNIVDVELRPGSQNLHVWSIWGRVGRAGRVCSILSPPSSI